MDRKKFLKNGLVGIGAMAVIPTLLTSCSKKDEGSVVKETKPVVVKPPKEIKPTPPTPPNDCIVSPTEIAGPFPIKTPASLIRKNIVGDRSGIPLMINIKVENTNNNCKPLEGVFVDIWHCDVHGNYSEYNHGSFLDFTTKHFLRGRQTTDANGNASFISIYPGWYPERAPHLHLEVKSSSGRSLLITQTAFPEDVSIAVYKTPGYGQPFDTSNARDGFFSKLSANIANTVTGNIRDGYTLSETLKVAV